MSTFYRTTGSRSRSPVEFQYRKALEGALDYSRRNRVVDFLLYGELRTGFLLGIHDLNQLSLPVTLGLPQEVGNPAFLHVSNRDYEPKASEPILISGGVAIASLIGGPDRGTSITKKTKGVLGLVLPSPQDGAGDVASAVAYLSTHGEELGLWRVTRIQEPTA